MGEPVKGYAYSFEFSLIQHVQFFTNVSLVIYFFQMFRFDIFHYSLGIIILSISSIFCLHLNSLSAVHMPVLQIDDFISNSRLLYVQRSNSHTFGRLSLSLFSHFIYCICSIEKICVIYVLYKLLSYV